MGKGKSESNTIRFRMQVDIWKLKYGYLGNANETPNAKTTQIYYKKVSNWIIYEHDGDEKIANFVLGASFLSFPQHIPATFNS